jgi:hypothetical protein
MPVDMVPARFIEELSALDAFRRYGKYDQRIQETRMPPKQAFLPGMFLYAHAAGYRLPTWESFSRYYVTAALKHKSVDKWAHCFDGGMPRPGLLWRMSGWYADSITHAFLYSVLAVAYEDLSQNCWVLYDARCDWKFKADAVVISCMDKIRAARVSLEGKYEIDRHHEEIRRDQNERGTKQNASRSAHWGNETFKNMPLVRTSLEIGKPLILKGFRLLGTEALEKLCADLDVIVGPRSQPMPVARMLGYRAA